MGPEELAETVKRLRRVKGFRTAEELAEASGVGVFTIQNIEAGRKKSIDRETLVGFCKAFDVSPYEFLPELDPTRDEAERQAERRVRRRIIEDLLRMDDQP